MLDDCFDYSLDDVVIRFQEVVAAHSGLARKSSGDHDDVAVGGFFVIAPGSGDTGGVDVDAENGRRFRHVECFSSRDSVQDVGEYDVSESCVMNPLRGGGPDKTSADNRYLLPHSQVFLRVLVKFVTALMCCQRSLHILDDCRGVLGGLEFSSSGH